MFHPERRREIIRQIAYEEGFHDGYAQALSEMPNIIRCKDCKKRYGGQCPYTSSGDPFIDQDTEDDWFCAEGEPKDK